MNFLRPEYSWLLASGLQSQQTTRHLDRVKVEQGLCSETYIISTRVSLTYLGAM